MNSLDCSAANLCAPQQTLGSLAALLAAENLLVQGASTRSELPVTGAASDSRHVAQDNIFVCKGAAFKPAYLQNAIKAGAVAYLCSEELAPQLAPLAGNVPALVTSDVRRSMALIAAAAFQRPDLCYTTVGLTGTKGKSTTAYLLHGILGAAQKRSGLIGSIETNDGIESFESINTTPEAPDLWRHLANARTANLDAMVMEISSQALKYDRSLGVHLDIACFLNLGHDHISPLEHPNFEDYVASKLKIFKQCDSAVVNLATTHLDRVLNAARQENLEGNIPDLVTVSAAGPDPVECGSCDVVFPDIWATDIKAAGSGLNFVAHGITNNEPWEFNVELGFPGLFNIDNALVAIACAELMNIPHEFIAKGLRSVQVPGRMQAIATNNSELVAVVDYAHNATSMEALLSSLRKTYPTPWQLNVVFGSTGSKGLERREGMGKAAGKYADRIILTEDDPGDENPQDICSQIAEHIAAQGNTNYEIILDREEAINQLVAGATLPAVVAAVGKGPDCYMEREGRIDPYEGDAAILERALKNRN